MTSVYSDDLPARAEPWQIELRPSASERWFNCPGSAWLSAVLPDSHNFAADQGTAAHEVLSCFIRRCEVPKTVLIEDTGGQFPVDDEMIDHARESLGLIKNETDWFTDGEIESEVKVAFHPDLKDRTTFVLGTADIVRCGATDLVLIDYKYGKSIVHTEGNKQLVTYMCALRQMYGRRDLYHMGILQPRAGKKGIRWWVLNNDELDILEKNLCAAIDRAYMYPPTFRTGSHCHWCHGKLVCPAACCDMIQAAVFGRSGAIDAEPNLWAIEHASTIRANLKWIEDNAFNRLEKGETINGYGLVDKEGNRSWKADTQNDLVIRAAEIGIPKDSVIVKPIGIVEAEKLGINLDGLTEKKISKKLVAIPKTDSLKGF